MVVCWYSYVGLGDLLLGTSFLVNLSEVLATGDYEVTAFWENIELFKLGHNIQRARSL